MGLTQIPTQSVMIGVYGRVEFLQSQSYQDEHVLSDTAFCR